jgi:hypothetical protein
VYASVSSRGGEPVAGHGTVLTPVKPVAAPAGLDSDTTRQQILEARKVAVTNVPS